MVRKRFGSFTLVSDVLFDLLCDEGKLEEAERCFCQMVELGQKPSNVAFRRIKILMQLAKQEESIARLTEKMAQFGRLAPGDCQRLQHSVESRLSNGDAAGADILRAA
jgi:pentatricopeptide repeat protein